MFATEPDFVNRLAEDPFDMAARFRTREALRLRSARRDPLTDQLVVRRQRSIEQDGDIVRHRG